MIFLILFFLVFSKCLAVREDIIPVMYRIDRGSFVKINNIVSNISYSMITDVTSPTNLTITPQNGAIMVPIFYANVYYLNYNVTTNLTDLNYLEYCNPIPNRDQGSLRYGIDNNLICPTLYKCIVNSLAPDVNYKNWPDLRCCLLNYTIIDRIDVPIIQTGSTVNASVVHARATLLSDIVNVTNTFGLIDCNDFISRSLNCQWTRQLDTYQEQCLSQPIRCFGRGIGQWFGGFFEQNPSFKYTEHQELWTEDLYKGVASTLNFKIYSKNGVIIDPLTSIVIKNYYWIPDLQELEQEVFDFGSPAGTYVVDLIQAQEYNWVSGLEPLPVTTLTNSITTAYVACVNSIVLSGDPTPCLDFTWTNLTSIGWRYPAYNIPIPILESVLVYSFTIQTRINFTGVEVFDAMGKSCGKYLKPTEGQNITFFCLQTIPSNGTMYVRFHGADTIFDLVGLALTTDVPGIPNLLETFLDLYPFNLTTDVNLVLGGILLQIGQLYKNWPGRKSTLYEQLYADPPKISVNFSDDNQGTQFLAKVEVIRNSILLNNTYPINYALIARSIEQGYTETDVDYNNPDHKDMLYRIWSTWYSPRQSGSEVSQCQTFRLGDTMYPVPGPKQFWYNGDAIANYDIPEGTFEGGCLCNNTLNFYNSYFFCARCVEGFGPNSVDEWIKVLQSNGVITTVLSDTYPFYLTSISNNVFENDFSCKFPMSPDPIASSLAAINVCSGHGLLTIQNDTYVFNQTETLTFGYWAFPTCSSIYLNNNEFFLQETDDLFAMQYVNGLNILTIVDGLLYYNNEACVFTKTQILPTYGLLQCDDLFTLSCVNRNLFTNKAAIFTNGYLREFNSFIAYFQ